MFVCVSVCGRERGRGALVILVTVLTQSPWGTISVFLCCCSLYQRTPPSVLPIKLTQIIVTPDDNAGPLTLPVYRQRPASE